MFTYNDFSLPTIHTTYPLVPIIFLFLAWPTRKKRTGSDTVARGDASHENNDMFDLGESDGELYTSEVSIVRRLSMYWEVGPTTCIITNERKRSV